MVVERDEKHSIWFEREDIQEADEPYLPSLLEESFHRWITEASELEALEYTAFRLYSKKLLRCGVAGQALDMPEEELNSAIAELAAQTHVTCDTATLTRHGYNITSIPLKRRSDGELFAFFVGIVSIHRSAASGELQVCALYCRSCFYRSFEQIYVKDMLRQQRNTEKEAGRRDALFLAAKRLYDQIDVTSVLAEMLHSLETLYANSEVHLYLAQDYVDGDARIKPLIFKNTAHDIVAQAFLDGKPATEKNRDGMIRLAVPMSGKQAAYGVLCLTIEAEKWEASNLPALLLLADTAGSAFENAKLYEQSNLLINELRLINEMTKRLNQSLRLNEIFQFATKELLTIFDADYCCVLQLNTTTNQFEIKSSNIPSLTSEAFSPQYGFCGIVYRTREPLIISDYWHTRVVTSEVMDKTGSRSLIATPVFVEGDVVGVILITHKVAHFFSYDNYKLLQVMSTHIGLAVANASLHSEMQRMVITDNLTGLHARHFLDEQIQVRQRKDPFGALILVDIDYFKRVNDTFGHQIGDQILIQVSKIINSCIRQDDIAARWGGEELAIYLPGIRLDQALRIAERIRRKVADETDPKVTVSCGVSEWTFDNKKISVESLFYRADMALYEAKNNGRNRIKVGELNANS